MPINPETGEWYDEIPPGDRPPGDMPVMITNKPESAAAYQGVSRMIPEEPRADLASTMPQLPHQTKAKEDVPEIPGPPGSDTVRGQFEKYARQLISDHLGGDPIDMSVADFKNKAWSETKRAADAARKQDFTATVNYPEYEQRVNDFIERKKEGMSQLDYMLKQFDKDHEVGTLAEGGATFDKGTGKVIASNPKEIIPKTPTEFSNFYAGQKAQGKTDAEIDEIWKTRELEKAEAARTGKGDLTNRDIYLPAIKALPKRKEEAETAERRVTQYEKLAKMAEGGAGGLVPGMKAILAPVAEALGMDTKITSEAQAYQLMARAGVGSMRLMLVGSGQVSNYEQDLMQKLSGGSIKTSREAAKKLFDYYAAESRGVVANYNKSVDELSQEYPEVKKAHGYVGKGKGSSAVKSPPANLLKEGVHTKFGNGQVWTMKNGTPEQVQ